LAAKERQATAMFCEWSGNHVKLRYDDRRILRTYSVRFPVQCAQVTGEGNDAKVAITMTNGRTVLYSGDGRLIRGE